MPAVVTVPTYAEQGHGLGFKPLVTISVILMPP